MKTLALSGESAYPIRKVYKVIIGKPMQGEADMKAARTRTTAQRETRRWRTPPPLIRGSESLEGMDILREVGGEPGVLLWQSYRNVMFWATAEPGERANLFSPTASARRLAEVEAAHIPQALAHPLAEIGRMLAAPDGVAPASVADACTAIARWAEEERHPSSSLAFTQAAALALPRSATLALAVGQTARQRGEIPRAESWYRHAIMVARQVGDWDAYSRAYLSLGNMSIERGNYPVAQRLHTKALRAARRKGLPRNAAFALHDLFVIAIHTGRGDHAEDFARKAFRAYSPEDERMPALAHDVAYYWMEHGHFARALGVFQALLPHFHTPADRIAILANQARAAGGSGDRDTFRRVWVEATRLSKDANVQLTLPGSMLDLARGAASLGEWDRAEQAADQAVKLATERRQAKVMMNAESLLDSIRNGRRFESVVERANTTHDADEADAFAADMVRSLELATSL
jgi:tetratricopeptide (TPR) repeat protein